MTGRREHGSHSILVATSSQELPQTHHHLLLRDEQEEDEKTVECVDQVENEEEEMVLEF